MHHATVSLAGLSTQRRDLPGWPTTHDGFYEWHEIPVPTDRAFIELYDEVRDIVGLACAADCDPGSFEIFIRTRHDLINDRYSLVVDVGKAIEKLRIAAEASA